MKSPKKIIQSLISIPDEPKPVASGFALGSFIGMLPIPGFQLLVSLGLATLFKLNKKAACIAVFNTNVATGAFVFSFNYWLGKNLLGVNPSFAVGEKVGIDFAATIIKSGPDVFLSLIVGGVLTGLLTATIVYFVLMKILLFRLQKLK